VGGGMYLPLVWRSVFSARLTNSDYPPERAQPHVAIPSIVVTQNAARINDTGIVRIGGVRRAT